METINKSIRSVTDSVRRQVNAEYLARASVRYNKRRECYQVWQGSELLDEKFSIEDLAIAWGVPLP